MPDEGIETLFGSFDENLKGLESALNVRLKTSGHDVVVEGAASVDRKVADRALSALEVDAAGLDAMDRRYLSNIALNYGGGPVGVDTIAAALSEPRDAIEDIIEPFLIQKGFIQRTPRGRLLTSAAFKHLGLAEPARDASQFGLFSGDEDE